MSAAKDLSIEWALIESIVPYEKNSKIHDNKQVAGIAASIKKFGWDQPIVVDKDGVIIKGHGRRLAAIELGMKKVPILRRTDLTPDQVAASRLADNRTALGELDLGLFREELSSLGDVGILSGIFEDNELEYSLANLGAMDESLFAQDLDEAVSGQQEQMREIIGAATTKRIPIARVLGFKDIAGADQIHINRLMSHIESVTGMTGSDALVEFAKATHEACSQ